jgi:hypothetical protein
MLLYYYSDPQNYNTKTITIIPHYHTHYHIYIHTYIHTYTQTPTHTHIHTHTYIHTHTHTYTHTHIHSQLNLPSLCYYLYLTHFLYGAHLYLTHTHTTGVGAGQVGFIRTEKRQHFPQNRSVLYYTYILVLKYYNTIIRNSNSTYSTKNYNTYYY